MYDIYILKNEGTYKFLNFFKKNPHLLHDKLINEDIFGNLFFITYLPYILLKNSLLNMDFELVFF
jgi:hypothetical protein